VVFKVSARAPVAVQREHNVEWFRMYNSMVDSVKVGKLSDSEFRTYVELQCLAAAINEGGRTGVTAESVDWRLRRDCHGDVTVTSQLVTLSLVTIGDGGEILVTDWAIRQIYDSSAERTRSYRERKAKSLKGKGSAGCDGGDSHGDDGDSHGDADKKRLEESITTSASNEISFDADAGKFNGITETQLKLWAEAFPAVDLKVEIAKAASWLAANPKNRKSNYSRFFTNWLSRQQDRAPRVGGKPIAVPVPMYEKFDL
jgi:hypothetical protein